nr:molybdate ABC transporter substrate-binding protein [uncultured Oscillibacter sp.]
MKRLLPILLALLVLPACGGFQAESPELVIFAASSLQEVLTEIGERYQRDRPNVTMVFHFDSSGTLKTQIAEGAACDLFISAGQTQMDDLDASVAPATDADNPGLDAGGGLDFVLSDTRVDLLENQVVLAVPEGNPAGIHSFDQLDAALNAGDILLAIGNSDVPVGQYTQKILAHYGLEEAALNAAGVLTYGSNVREVTTQVAEGTVDCGIIYATDARSAGVEIVDAATADMCGQVLYPAAVMTAGTNQSGARDFLAFLRTEEAAEVFAQAGFTPLE